MDAKFSGTDRILRATGEVVEIRFVLVDATAAANHIADAHGALGFARQLLGESLTGSLLLASGLKWPGTVQLRFTFTGDISQVSADATPLGLVRAMIPQDELENTGSFEPMLLPQTLAVRKLDREGRTLSEGVVEMPSTEISTGLTHYLHQSEQGKALARVSALCDESGERLRFCGGFLLEGFPGLRDADWLPLILVAQNLSFEDFIRNDGEGLDLTRLFATLTAAFPSQIHQEFGVEPFCPCSEAGVLNAMSGLGKDELESLCLENEDAEVFCEFCRRRYIIRPDQIRGLLDGMKIADEDEDDEGFLT